MEFYKFVGGSIDLLIVILSALVLQFLFNRFVDVYLVERFYKVVHGKAKRINKKRLNTLGNLFKKIFSVVVWVFATLLILGILGFDLTKILAGLGAFSIVLAIVWKDAIIDLYYGFLVLAQDNYRVGDTIVVNSDHSGVVKDITFLSVKLIDERGSLHVVPHSLARAITNVTYDHSVVSILLSVKTGTDLKQCIKLINDLGSKLASEKKWDSVFIESLQFDALVGSDAENISLLINAKVKPSQNLAAKNECKMRLFELFAANKITASIDQK